MHPNLQDYKQVQTIAKTVLEEIKSFIGADKTEKDKRLYFESGNKETLKENALFTFEPHIRKIEKNYGFKLENIYYFDEDGSAREL